MTSIKDFIKQGKHSNNSLLRLIYHCVRYLLLSRNFVSNAAYRSDVLYGFLYAKDYHQKSSLTMLDRYPLLFKICRDFFKVEKELKILSFGCSTGEEVETLSKYFPKALIVGTDINKRAIQLAMGRYQTNRKVFIHSLSPEFRRMREFDIIFCCAIFQSTSNRTSDNNSISDYKFSKFESKLETLDKMLSVGGLIAITHCDFRFVDTSIFQRYKILDVEHNQQRRDRPCYDKTNRKISDFSENHRVFVKMSD